MEYMHLRSRATKRVVFQPLQPIYLFTVRRKDSWQTHPCAHLRQDSKAATEKRLVRPVMPVDSFQPQPVFHLMAHFNIRARRAGAGRAFGMCSQHGTDSGRAHCGAHGSPPSWTPTWKNSLRTGSSLRRPGCLARRVGKKMLRQRSQQPEKQAASQLPP
jgi:hypothetical protein